MGSGVNAHIEGDHFNLSGRTRPQPPHARLIGDSKGLPYRPIEQAGDAAVRAPADSGEEATHKNLPVRL